MFQKWLFFCKQYWIQNWAFEIQLLCNSVAAPNFQLTLVNRISKEDESKDSVSLWLDDPLGCRYQVIGMTDIVQRSIVFRISHCSSQWLDPDLGEYGLLTSFFLSNLKPPICLCSGIVLYAKRMPWSCRFSPWMTHNEFSLQWPFLSYPGIWGSLLSYLLLLLFVLSLTRLPRSSLWHMHR